MERHEEELDLYNILGVRRDSSKSEIKKAYHKAALSCHPDKVAEDQRSTAEIRFKLLNKAYEILYDEGNRRLYDVHGISAFNRCRENGMEAEVDVNEMLRQMFTGHSPPSDFRGPYFRMSRRGGDEVQDYNVTLEELYQGKIARFASTKNVICTNCKGSGGREKAKLKQCVSCSGRGLKEGLKSLGPGLLTQQTVTCNSCKGRGLVFNAKDYCKRCRGDRTTKFKKVLELYIPPGSNHGDRIILDGEADEAPDQTPGNIIFHLVQIHHEIFQRSGANLLADMEITLAESLCGFSRVVIQHLDGRGIRIQYPQEKEPHTLKPGQTIRIAGEGMPIKKSELRGDLYFIVRIAFPEHSWLEEHQATAKLEALLPRQRQVIEADVVDDVIYDGAASLDDFGVVANEEPVNDKAEDGLDSQCAHQ